MPWTSVRNNVLLPLRHKKLAQAERTRLVEEALERGRPRRGSSTTIPWQLSGGMQQRVAIARALAYQPSILLMDEPFASVDAQTRGDLEDLVLRVRDEFGITILFVTHDIDESVYLSDRVVVLTHCADRGEGGRRRRPRRAARPDRDEGAAGVRAPARARLPADQARHHGPGSVDARRRRAPRVGRSRDEDNRSEAARPCGDRGLRDPPRRGPVRRRRRRCPGEVAGDRGQRDGRRPADRQHAAARPRHQEGLLRAAGDRDQEDHAQSGNDIVLGARELATSTSASSAGSRR